MHIHWGWFHLTVAALAALASTSHAQSAVTPEDEYKKLIRVSEEIQPLGDNPFGERINLHDGGLSFEVIDASLAGDGPALQVIRSFRPKTLAESETVDGAFADWDIEIPRITTLAAPDWVTGSGKSPARCTNFGSLPPTIKDAQGNASWEPVVWWSGYPLIVPGHGSQDLLRRASTNDLVPSVGGITHGIVTTRHWVMSCGIATDDQSTDPGGEGFLAIAPDGTRYWFNHLVYRWAPTITRSVNAGPGDPLAAGISPMSAPFSFLHRRLATMLVTRIEDRFGKHVTYSYDGDRLVTMTASDGRRLDLSYASETSRIVTVTTTSSDAPARTWRYQYDVGNRPTLTRVTLPDNSLWTYAFADLHTGEVVMEGGGGCDVAAVLSDNLQTGTAVHPSGLAASFTVRPTARGRSYVPRQCVITAGQPLGYVYIPRDSYGYAITRKSFSGAGLTPQAWTYKYSPANASWKQDCAASCASTIWTDVVDPEGKSTRSTFSNRFDETEGQLLRTDRYSGAVGTSTLRSEINHYAAADAGPWPANYGSNLQSRMNTAVVSKRSPLEERNIIESSDTYTWLAETFDEFTQPVRIKRARSLAGVEQESAHEQTTYHNDRANWVLGLPLQTDSLTANEVVNRYVYEPSNATLKQRWRFGQKVMDYTFDAAGHLASFTNAMGHTTTLGNYKRGIPRRIGYPDGSTQALEVDDYGQITSSTNPLGYTISYTWDVAGRLAGIQYAAGDEQAWLPTTFNHSYVSSAERGLAGGHWRRMVSHGSARTVSYFDAMMRPVLTDKYIDGIAGSNTTTLTNYDTDGRTTFTSYPSAIALIHTSSPATLGISGVASSYDALGRTTLSKQDSELGMLTTSTAYLPGARRQVTSPKGYTTTTSYQAFDAPAYEAPTKIDAPEGVTLEIRRNAYGEPLSIRQHGNLGGYDGDVTRALTYDSNHRLCRTTEPESGSEVRAYDTAGNLAWSAAGLSISGNTCGLEQVPVAARTTRTYDTMNRLLTIQPPAGTQTTTYAYDAMGNPTNTVSGLSTWSANYNKRGMLTRETLQLSGKSAWRADYAHNAYGSLAQMTYPDGETVAYAPDALGRPTQVGGYLGNIAYHPNGAVAQASLGNGTGYVTELNTRQLLSNLSYGRGSSLQISEDIAYDKHANPTQMNDLVDGQRNQAMSYDARDRLTGATAANLWGSETYAYDPLDNLRLRTNSGTTASYLYDGSNRLAAIAVGGTNTPYAYDSRGNTTLRNGQALSWDANNRLLAIAGKATYAYDSEGRRVMKTQQGGGSTYTFYNHAGHLIYQEEPGKAKTTSFAYLGSQLVGINETSTATPPPATAPTLNTPSSSATGNYTVSWNSVTAATGYTLQESVNGSGWVTVQSNANGSWSTSNRGNGSYAYRAQACNSGGCGPWSGTSTVTVLMPPTSAPNLSVPGNSNTGSFTVNWSLVATAASYTLQESVDGAGWSTVLTANVTTWNTNSRSNGTYTYRVQACNTGGCGPWSPNGSISVIMVPGTPDAPNLSRSGTTQKPVVKASWSATAGTTNYQLEETHPDEGVLVFDNGTATNWSSLIFATGTVKFRVRACNSAGCSAYSAYKSITLNSGIGDLSVNPIRSPVEATQGDSP